MNPKNILKLKFKSNPVHLRSILDNKKPENFWIIKFVYGSITGPMFMVWANLQSYDSIVRRTQ